MGLKHITLNGIIFVVTVNIVQNTFTHAHTRVCARGDGAQVWYK
jgi:hypothetical protein